MVILYDVLVLCHGKKAVAKSKIAAGSSLLYLDFAVCRYFQCVDLVTESVVCYLQLSMILEYLRLLIRNIPLAQPVEKFECLFRLTIR